MYRAKMLIGMQDTNVGIVYEQASISGHMPRTRNHLSLTVGGLRDGGYVLSFQVILNLANLLATPNPAFTESCSPVISQLVQRGPVACVIIFEFDVTPN